MLTHAALIVDLDHTLVHSLTKRVSGFDTFAITLSGGQTYEVHVRPYVREFLTFLLSKRNTMKIGFWTAGTREYAHRVLENLFRLIDVKDYLHRVDLVFSREQALLLPCGSYVKQMSKVERALGVEVAFLLDDDDVHTRCARNQVLPAPKFIVDEGEQDVFLLEFITFTEMLLRRGCAA